MKPKAEKARRMEAIGPKLYNKSVHVSAIRPEDQKPVVCCLMIVDFTDFPTNQALWVPRSLMNLLEV